MAIAFSRYVRGTASAASATAAVDLSPCSVGHLGLVHIARSTATTPSDVPGGWALLQEHATTAYAAVYGKVLAGGDIGTVTWTFSDSTKTRVLASVYTGASVTSSAKGTWDPVNVGTTVDCGSITTSSTWVAVLCSCYWTAEVTYGALAGYTERDDFGDVDSDRWMMVADTAGTWGGGACAPDFTLSLASTASRRAGFLVELQEYGGETDGFMTVTRLVQG